MHEKLHHVCQIYGFLNFFSVLGAGSWPAARQVMGLVCCRLVRTSSQGEKLGRCPLQQPITLIALKIIFRQINMNPVCSEPEGD